MRKSFLFVWVGLSLVVFQAGCSKKIAPVSGTAALSDERSAGSLPPAGISEEGIREERVTSESPAALEAGKSDQAAAEGSEDLLDVFFEFDQAVIKEESKVNLQKNAKRLVEGRMKLRIEGHADERGTEEYNLTLGERRAQAVKRFLTALGIDKGRIQTITYGEERPFCNQHEENCYKQNRRAHFVVTP